ncbi:aldo/keto reductase [Nocardia gamkensis]|uniref:aldo/keto reductase n=1 Tax=Nocardia gamkensis TaxID=352869 RepID=UPI0033C586FC
MEVLPTFAIGGDREVRRLGFGTVRLLGPGVWGEPPDPEQHRALLRFVVDSGVNFLDTADAYGPHVAERLIAEALYPYPDDLVIATKGGMEPSGPGAWERNGRPEYLRSSCENSLRRLKLDCIELYQLHAVDPAVPLEDSIGALVELHRRGLVRYIGLCNVNADELLRARASTAVASVQNRYNVVDRDSEPVLRICERSQIAFLPWYPLGRGSLSTASGVVAEIARRTEATPAQITIAWLLHRAPNIVAIPGTSSLGHFIENLAAADIRLTRTDVAALTDRGPDSGQTPPDNGFPSQ